ncbi:Rrf2 family transcriptional regulator [Phragmitibacter flavus]|uniref:Rrf2 family transcriptional regulator n=1 Tax=Phragmitibacter flavus TaxID=2576071 RepID=A0A5R8KJ54_9BACT|nr:Rrf2 family transcriptional regulator [Phragmitibacter flavus]TLD72368.1 Rrf2 family transcriptional regulator [Phragmitibacter flavus]
MELSRFSDYSLRVLMYAAAKEDEKVTLGELAAVYRISQHHLVKIVHYLGKLGYLQNRRGRSGGIRLGMPPAEIRVGDVIRHTETHFNLAECFSVGSNLCRLTPGCRLKGVFHEATEAFLGVLDGYTLEDLVLSSKPTLLLLSLNKGLPMMGGAMQPLVAGGPIN